MRSRLLILAAAAAISTAAQGNETRKESPTPEQCAAAVTFVGRYVAPDAIFETLPPAYDAASSGPHLALDWTKSAAPSFTTIRKFESAPRLSAFACQDVANDLRKRRIRLSNTPDVSRASDARLVRVGIPVIGDSGDEALVLITEQRSRGIGGASRVFLLKKTSHGAWAVAAAAVLSVS